MHTSNTWQKRGILVAALCLLGAVAVVSIGTFTGPRLEYAGMQQGYVALRFNRMPDKTLVSSSLQLTPPVAVRKTWQGSELRLYPIEGLPMSGALLLEGKTTEQHTFQTSLPLPQVRVTALRDGIPFIEDKALPFDHVQAISVADDRLLLQRVTEEKTEILLYRISCSCTQTVSDSSEGWHIRQAILAPDGSKVLLHQVRPTQLASVEAVRLWVWDAETRKTEPFWFQNVLSDAMWTTPEGAGALLMETGNVQFVPFIPKENGEVTFLGKYDRVLDVTGNALLFGTFKQERLVLQLAEFGKPVEEISFPELDVESAQLSQDAQTVYLLARPRNSADDPTTPRQVWSYFRVNKVLAQVTKEPLWSVVSMRLSPNGEEMALVRRRPVESGREELAALHLATGTLRLVQTEEATHWRMPQWIRLSDVLQ